MNGEKFNLDLLAALPLTALFMFVAYLYGLFDLLKTFPWLISLIVSAVLTIFGGVVAALIVTK